MILIIIIQILVSVWCYSETDDQAAIYPKISFEIKKQFLTDEIDLIEEGDEIVAVCVWEYGCGKKPVQLLDDKMQIMDKQECSAEGRPKSFRFNFRFKANSSLGSYHCSVNNITGKENLPVSSAICAANSEICQTQCSDSQEWLYCVRAFTKPGDPCTKLESISCPDNKGNFTYCPSGKSSFCQVASNNNTVLLQNAGCTPEDEVKLTYNTETIRYADVIQIIRGANKLAVVCSRNSIFYDKPLLCKFYRLNSNTPETMQNYDGHCSTYTSIPLPKDVFDTGSYVLKLICTVTNNKQMAHLRARLAVFDTRLMITVDSQNQNAGFMWKNPAEPGFSFSISWKDEKGIEVAHGTTHPRNAGLLTCTVTFHYRGCNPHKHFMIQRPCTEPVATNPDTFVIIIAAACGTGGFLLILIIGAIICYKRRKAAKKKKKRSRRAKGQGRRRAEEEASFVHKNLWLQQLQLLQLRQIQEQKPFEPLRKLLDDKEKTLDFVALKREAARLISMRPQQKEEDGTIKTNDQPQIVAYIRSIIDEEAEALACQNNLIKTLHNCRSSRVEIRVDTQLVLQDKSWIEGELHLSKLQDYYGNLLLLGQAPLKTQFVDYWQAVWEQKVGVLVWVGDFVEMGKPKIDPYIPLKEGGKSIHGPFTIQTTFVIRIKGEFDAYRVSAKRYSEARSLVVVHVSMWPDRKLPEVPALLADLVAQIHGQQLKQAQQGLTAMLVHCSIGVQRSPALLAVYIARQTWLANRKANIHGILQYIRRQRFRAFGFGNPFGQVQIVFGVMQVIATRHEMEGFGDLNVETHEREVFDQKLRRADIERESISGHSMNKSNSVNNSEKSSQRTS